MELQQAITTNPGEKRGRTISSRYADFVIADDFLNEEEDEEDELFPIHNNNKNKRSKRTEFLEEDEVHQQQQSHHHLHYNFEQQQQQQQHQQQQLQMQHHHLQQLQQQQQQHLNLLHHQQQQQHGMILQQHIHPSISTIPHVDNNSGLMSVQSQYLPPDQSLNILSGNNNAAMNNNIDMSGLNMLDISYGHPALSNPHALLNSLPHGMNGGNIMAMANLGMPQHQHQHMMHMPPHPSASMDAHSNINSFGHLGGLGINLADVMSMSMSMHPSISMGNPLQFVPQNLGSSHLPIPMPSFDGNITNFIPGIPNGSLLPPSSQNIAAAMALSSASSLSLPSSASAAASSSSSSSSSNNNEPISAEKNKWLSKNAITRPVSVYDMEGNFQSDFDNMMDAANAMGLQSMIPISKCCRGLQKSYQGYQYRFKNSPNPGPLHRIPHNYQQQQQQQQQQQPPSFSAAASIIRPISQLSNDVDLGGGNDLEIVDESDGVVVDIRKKKGKSVVVTDLSGNFVAEYISEGACSRALNITQSVIARCCNGNQRSAGNYKFYFKADGEESDPARALWAGAGGSISKSNTSAVPQQLLSAAAAAAKRKKTKAVLCYDMQGVLISEYESTDAAATALNIKKYQVQECAKGKIDHAGDYRFCYSIPGDNSAVSQPSRPIILDDFSKAVDVYSQATLELLKQYDSIDEAAKAYNFSPKYISHSCRGLPAVSAGYIFKYKGEPAPTSSLNKKSATIGYVATGKSYANNTDNNNNITNNNNNSSSSSSSSGSSSGVGSNNHSSSSSSSSSSGTNNNSSSSSNNSNDNTNTSSNSNINDAVETEEQRRLQSQSHQIQHHQELLDLQFL